MTIPSTLVMFSIVQGSVENVARARFEQVATDAHAIIARRLRSYSDVLYSLRALFATDEPVDRRRFHHFVESLELKRRYPGFLALNYAAFVPGHERTQFEEMVRHDSSLNPGGYPEFTIKPPGERAEYFVIVYIEPMAGYEFAFGLDLGANPMAADPKQVAAAVRLQRDSGKLISAAQPLRVPRIGGSIFLAMRLAVFREGMPVNTVEQRRVAYVGSVGAGFDVAYLFKDAPGDSSLNNMHVKLYDAGSADAAPAANSHEGKRLIFDSSRPGKAQASSVDQSTPKFTYVLPVKIASRTWEFHYSAPKSAVISGTDRFLPGLVLGGGLVTSVLLFGILYSLSYSRAQAVEIARHMTQDLRHSTDELQKLSRRLVELQELDRREFARELHDRVGQNLTALSISLNIVKMQLAAGGNETIRSRLEDAAALLETTAKATENVMADLRPPMLDDYGLMPALQWYAGEFSGRVGMPVSVVGDVGLGVLTPEREIGLFRIVQEALNNVAKHAHATRIRIELERVNSHLVMSIADDGVGYGAAPASLNHRRVGLGLETMRERTRALGGEFEINAAEGASGTVVRVRIPC